MALRRTVIALILAMLAVSGSGAVIVERFATHLVVPCRGRLEAVRPANVEDLGDRGGEELVPDKVIGSTDGMIVRYDDSDRIQLGLSRDVRVEWLRADRRLACSDAPVRWTTIVPPRYLVVKRLGTANLFVVRDAVTPTEAPPPAIFRTVDVPGQRVLWDRILDGHNLSVAVLLVAIGALLVAAFRTFAAMPYATRIHAWAAATLREDGLVEAESGATLGKLEAHASIPSGDVLVDPSASDNRDIYRALPILSPRAVRAGSHEHGYCVTTRRLRDARSLAVLATATTMLALLARLLGG